MSLFQKSVIQKELQNLIDEKWNEFVSIFHNSQKQTNIRNSKKEHYKEEFFKGYSVPRIKEIMRIFKDLRLVEQLGSGVPRILQTYSHECFRFSENFVRVTFPISIKLTSEIEKNSKLVEGLVENQKKMVYLIDQKPTITIKKLAESIRISTTAIDKNLTKLKDKNILRRIGGDKKGRWELFKNNLGRFYKKLI